LIRSTGVSGFQRVYAPAQHRLALGRELGMLGLEPLFMPALVRLTQLAQNGYIWIAES